jgi:hypothetical protein
VYNNLKYYLQALKNLCNVHQVNLSGMTINYFPNGLVSFSSLLMRPEELPKTVQEYLAQIA